MAVTSEPHWLEEYRHNVLLSIRACFVLDPSGAKDHSCCGSGVCRASVKIAASSSLGRLFSLCLYGSPPSPDPLEWWTEAMRK
jgi:hypothetical protein